MHARAAVLGGLSPAQNRAAPPLDYDRVARLKRGWRDKAIWLNGGIGAAAAARRQLCFVDGVMAGRAATRDPLFLAETAAALAGDERIDRAAARRAAAAGFLPYLRRQIEAGEDPRRGGVAAFGFGAGDGGGEKNPRPNRRRRHRRLGKIVFGRRRLIPRPFVARLGAWARLIRLGSPAGWLLLLWPTLWGLWLAAAGMPAPKWIFVFRLRARL